MMCDFSGIVYNWPTMISLLLRESDDLISHSLSTYQASVLLRIFVHAAVELNEKRLSFADQVSLTSSERQCLQWWEALNRNLISQLHTLLTRFKDDEKNLAMLVDLLACADYSVDEKASKQVLKVVLELVEVTRNESVLTKLVSALCGWTRVGGTISSAVEATVRDMVETCWGSVLDGTTQLQNVVNRQSASQGSSSKKSSSSKRKSGSGVSQVFHSANCITNCCELFLYLYVY